MKTNGPWKIKGSQKIYANAWMKVHEDQVIRPDGKDGIIGIVEMRNGVSVLPIDDNENVYLTEQFRYTMKKNMIEAVTGGVGDNEKSLDAAKRELKEELGIDAAEWIDLGLVDPFTAAIKSSHNIYLVRKLKFIQPDPDGTENVKPVKIKLAEAVKMVMDSKITNGPSCVLILKANEYLKK